MPRPKVSKNKAKVTIPANDFDVDNTLKLCNFYHIKIV